MHADEIVTTPEQVRRLVAGQFPAWAGLPVTRVAEFGTDHCLFRLGDLLAARMPRVPAVAAHTENDARWLPFLARHLPVAVPSPLALGEPGPGYPWPWSVVPWLPGRTPTPYAEDLEALAVDLAGFVRDLHAVPAAGGPRKPPGSRGGALRHIDEHVRRGIAECGDRVDQPAVLAAWEDAVSAPEWTGDPVWIHGDLMAGNLLVDGDDRLAGVIDFAWVGVGDPAPDLIAAYCLLPPGPREAFREAVGYDEDTWRRGRGWAMGPALTGIPYYWDSVPAFARQSQRTVAVAVRDLV